MARDVLDDLRVVQRSLRGRRGLAAPSAVKAPSPDCESTLGVARAARGYSSHDRGREWRYAAEGRGAASGPRAPRRPRRRVGSGPAFSYRPARSHGLTAASAGAGAGAVSRRNCSSAAAMAAASSGEAAVRDLDPRPRRVLVAVGAHRAGAYRCAPSTPPRLSSPAAVEGLLDQRGRGLAVAGLQRVRSPRDRLALAVIVEGLARDDLQVRAPRRRRTFKLTSRTIRPVSARVRRAITRSKASSWAIAPG